MLVRACKTALKTCCLDTITLASRKAYCESVSDDSDLEEDEEERSACGAPVRREDRIVSTLVTLWKSARWIVLCCGDRIGKVYVSMVPCRNQKERHK